MRLQLVLVGVLFLFAVATAQDDNNDTNTNTDEDMMNNMQLTADDDLLARYGGSVASGFRRRHFYVGLPC